MKRTRRWSIHLFGICYASWCIYTSCFHKVLQFVQASSSLENQPANERNVGANFKKMRSLQKNLKFSHKILCVFPNEDSLIFCEEFSLDLMFINGRAITHMVDTEICVSTAMFLNSAEGNLWKFCQWSLGGIYHVLVYNLQRLSQLAEERPMFCFHLWPLETAYGFLQNLITSIRSTSS